MTELTETQKQEIMDNVELVDGELVVQTYLKRVLDEEAMEMVLDCIWDCTYFGCLDEDEEIPWGEVWKELEI